MMASDQGLHNSRTLSDLVISFTKFLQRIIFRAHLENVKPQALFFHNFFPTNASHRSNLGIPIKAQSTPQMSRRKSLSMWSAVSIFGFGATAVKAKSEIVVFIGPFLVQNRDQLARKLSRTFSN